MGHKRRRCIVDLRLLWPRFGSRKRTQKKGRFLVAPVAPGGGCRFVPSANECYWSRLDGRVRAKGPQTEPFRDNLYRADMVGASRGGPGVPNDAMLRSQPFDPRCLRHIHTYRPRFIQPPTGSALEAGLVAQHSSAASLSRRPQRLGSSPAAPVLPPAAASRRPHSAPGGDCEVR